MKIAAEIEDLVEEVYHLRLFDSHSEINTYCDELESQVMLSIESAIEHLHQVQEKLLGKIADYKNKLLQYSESKPTTSAGEEPLQFVLKSLADEIRIFKSICVTAPE